MKILNRTVSKKFRGILANKYPNLGNDGSFWLFLSYLMFGMYREEESGRLLIPAEIVARIENKYTQWFNNNYIAWDFLERFSRYIQPFKWSKWDSESRLVRVVTELTWDQEIFDAIQAERLKLWKNTGRVYISDGSEFTRNKQAIQRKREKLNALELLDQAGCKEAQELLDYMNNLPPNLFYNILQNIPKAIEAAKRLPPQSSDRQIDILHAVLDQYQPFYKPTSGSTRIYSFNENMLGLQRDVRKALTSGWSECDLKSAQLAICAKIWDVPPVQKFLKDGHNIWDSLFEYFQFEKNEETKRLFKTALYTVMYGGRAKRIKNTLAPLGEDACSKFLTHPIIRAMWRARTEQLKLIRKNKGAMNYFGKSISTANFNPKSVLAQLAQAYELALLYPALELAKKDKRFQIVLWQHDGFSVHWLKKEDIENLKHNLKYVVEDKAEQLGIITKLEID
jgi:hypothetical protein